MHRPQLLEMLRRSLSVFGAAVVLVSNAPASDQAAATTPEEPLELDRMVVTGSYLSGAAAVNASPLVTIERAAIEQAGATDVLRLLKKLTPAFSGQNNVGNEVVFQGVGESYVALRNLPTLVLVNGRRLANSPFSSSTTAATIPSVDLNNIPLGMIERIEVLKDSASTIYGSDAVGGVVNVVLRKNYDGLETGLRYGTDRGGDYETKEAWVTAGVTRPGMSLTVGGQYFKSTKLLTTARKLAILDPADLVALGQNPGVLAAHVSSVYAGRNGNSLIAGSPLAIGAPGYNPAILSLPPKTDPNAAPLTMAELEAAGYYIPISSTPLSQAAGGSPTILNTSLYGFALILPSERQQAFASGHKELFGRRLEAFGDFLFSRMENGGSDLAPAPIAAVAPSNLSIPANNPYNLFGVRIGVGGAANAPGLRTRLDEIGSRFSDNRVDTYRIVAGLRGEINERWNWEGALNYIRAKGTQTIHGGANGAVMNQLLIPQLTADGSAYVYDAQGRPLSVYVRDGRNVPVFDYFGVAGSNAPETIDALRTTLRRNADIIQRSFDLRATGKLFPLPAGDVAVAIGGEIRRERLSSWADDIFSSGLALGYIPVTGLDRGERRTSALFLETQIPLAAPENEIPFVHRADLTAAVRTERIRPGGDATSPKFGLRWLPFDEQLVMRATYSRGFVAPSVFALFGPPQGAFPTLTLPEGNGQTGSGGATGRMVTGQFIAQTIERSNPNLAAAESESHTVGLVYSPRQIKGLTLSADYYRIEQDKVGGFDYTFIIADLNARGAASSYAANFRFTDGTSLTGNAPNQVTSTNAGSLGVLYNPLGDIWTNGLDLAVDYRFAPAGLGAFGVGADANVLFNTQARTAPTSRYYQYARSFTESINGKGNPQGLLPGYVLRGHVDHAFRQLSTSLRVNYVPSVNAPGTAFGEQPGFPNILRADLKPYTIPSYTTVDLSFTYSVSDTLHPWAKGLSVTLGANNLFDRDAPFVPGGGSGVGSEANTVKSTYDIIGRFVFLGVRKEF